MGHEQTGDQQHLLPLRLPAPGDARKTVHYVEQQHARLAGGQLQVVAQLLHCQGVACFTVECQGNAQGPALALGLDSLAHAQLGLDGVPRKPVRSDLFDRTAIAQVHLADLADFASVPYTISQIQCI